MTICIFLTEPWTSQTHYQKGLEVNTNVSGSKDIQRCPSTQPGDIAFRKILEGFDTIYILRIELSRFESSREPEDDCFCHIETVSHGNSDS